MNGQTTATHTVAVSKRLRAILEKQLQEAAEEIAARHVELGRRIKLARDAMGLKQKELAAKVHVEPTTISRWERGVHAPDMTKLYRLAAVFNKPISELVAGLGMEEPAPAIVQALDDFERRLAATEKRLGQLEEGAAKTAATLEGMGETIRRLGGEASPATRGQG